MKKKHQYSITILVLFLLLVSCNQKKTKQFSTSKEKIKYAKGFDIKKYPNYSKLIIKHPYPESKEVFEYILYDKSQKKPDVEGIKIGIPIEKIVVTSTTHISMLELLNQQNTLVGFPHTNYISSPKTRAQIDSGKVKEIGIKASINTEIVLDLNPEIIVGFSMTKTNKTLNLIESSGIPVLMNGAWLEETPLGRAEWIRFFGALYQMDKQADSIFSSIETNYLQIKKIAQNSNYKPSILSGAIMSKDIWSLPAGDSFVAQFLKDANTNYLWKNSNGKGSLSISFESVLDKGISADFWIAPGYFTNKEQMLQNNKNYQSFKAFNEDKIYTFANKKGITGGVIYYEKGPTRPDLILKDLIKITHPDLLPNYTLTFFEQMK